MTSFHNLVSFQSNSVANAHIIRSDAEALEIATRLAEQFQHNAIQRDSDRQLPFDEIESYSQSGLWAITVPKEYGGAEVSSYTVARIIALMSGADGSIGQIPQNHFYALEVLRNTGTVQQKQKLYAEVLKGARFGNALAEFKTKNSTQKYSAISATSDGFEVNGEKFYCTGSLSQPS
jgi:alkylation response protein AidB-like acyl-CoA dehydrogenase